MLSTFIIASIKRRKFCRIEQSAIGRAFLLLFFTVLLRVSPLQAQSVKKILRSDPDTAITTAAAVKFSVIFDDSVTNVSLSDFTLFSDVGGSMQSVQKVTDTSYLVSVHGIENANGDLALGLLGVDTVGGSNNIKGYSYTPSLFAQQTMTNDYLNQSVIGQTFTATSSGALTNFVVFPDPSNHTFGGTVIVKIYEGDIVVAASLVMTDTLNLTDDVSVSGQNMRLTSPLVMATNQTYTITLSDFDGAGTYALLSSTAGDYSGGHVYFSGYNNGSHADFDLRIELFETAVTPLTSNAPLVHESYTRQYVNIAPVATNVSISGDSIVGSTLTGTYTWSDSNEADTESGSTYQWYRAEDASGASAIAIAGANGVNYTVQLADYTKFLSFEVTPNDGTEMGAPVSSRYVEIAAPKILSVTIPEQVYNVGDVIDVSIQADASGLLLDSGAVNGVSVTNFTELSGGMYTASYTLEASHQNRYGIDDISVFFRLKDQNDLVSNSYATAIKQEGDPLVTYDEEGSTLFLQSFEAQTSDNWNYTKTKQVYDLSDIHPYVEVTLYEKNVAGDTIDQDARQPYDIYPVNVTDLAATYGYDGAVPASFYNMTYFEPYYSALQDRLNFGVFESGDELYLFLLFDVHSEDSTVRQGGYVSFSIAQSTNDLSYNPIYFVEDNDNQAGALDFVDTITYNAQEGLVSGRMKWKAISNDGMIYGPVKNDVNFKLEQTSISNRYAFVGYDGSPTGAYGVKKSRTTSIALTEVNFKKKLSGSPITIQSSLDTTLISSNFKDIAATSGDNFFAIQNSSSSDTTARRTLDFVLNSLNDLHHKRFKFDYYAGGLDGKDSIYVQMSYSNSPDWSSPDDQFMLSGQTNGWVTFKKSIDASVTDLAVRLVSHTNGEEDTVAFDNISLEEVPLLWYGESGVDWLDAANWSGGFVPTSSSNVAILDVVNDPEIDGFVQVNDLIILSGGAITIMSDDTLQVNGDFINHQAEGLTVESGGVFKLLGTRTGNGTEKLERTATGQNALQLIGSPLSNASVADLACQFAYAYSTSQDQFSIPTSLMPGVGYAVGYSGENKKIALTGQINSGNVAVSITDDGSSYNLVSNPYAAAIDAVSFFSVNSSKITGEAWLWADGGGNGTSSRLGNYVTVNSVGAAGGVVEGKDSEGAGTTVKGTSNWNGSFNSFQGFFVKAVSGADSLMFTPAMQADGNNADDHFFRIADRVESCQLRLSLSGNGLVDNILVVLDEFATLEHDYSMDGKKYSGNSYISFYAIQHDEKYAISVLPLIEQDSLELKLAHDLQEAGDYNLTVEQFDDFPSEMVVKITDSFTGEVYELSPDTQIAFSNEMDSAIANQRFSLSFLVPSEEAVLGVKDSKKPKIALYGSLNEMILRGEHDGLDHISVYTLSGQSVLEQDVFFDNQEAVLFSEVLTKHRPYLLKSSHFGIIKFIYE